MNALWRNVHTETRSDGVSASFLLINQSRETWSPETHFIAWQFFDPETNRFILEGEWRPVEKAVAPGDSVRAAIEASFDPMPAGYRIYVSLLHSERGWAYARGDRFLLIYAEMTEGGARLLSTRITTLRSIRLESLRRALPRFFTLPVRSLIDNRALLRSMVRRDILARYRGSFGDVLWTVLNPLLLMLTYYFVFGVVLRARFGNDTSGSGYVLYFLAGMLPWLAFSEPAGRAPWVILEHRNFVKKLVFPLEILPVVQVISGLVTESIALLIFIAGILLLRGRMPLTAVALPLVVVPQVLFTIGWCWFLAALAVYFRDVAQINGFVLTAWFFLTPICYPVASLPRAALVLLRKNPLYVMVDAYRAVLLDGRWPATGPCIKLWLLGIAVFLLGHAWFHKLRKGFADVI